MAFKMRRKKTFRRKRHGLSTAVKADKALKIARTLKKAVERKYYQATSGGAIISDYSASSVGSMIDLFTPAQGIGASQRIGDKVALTSFKFHFQVVTTAAGAAAQTMRIIFFFMKNENVQTVANMPTQLIASGLNSIQAVHALYREVDRQDFTILYDKNFTVNKSCSNDGHVHKITLPMRNHVVEFASTATTKEDGGFYMMILGDAAVNTGATIYYNYQINYNDA